MRRFLRASVVTGVLGFVFAACGSRTALVDGELDNVGDSSTDGTTSDVIGRDNFTPTDAPIESSTDAPLVEGGPLDVQVDCNEPKYCDPRDTGYIYQCGVRVFQCSSLEECKNAQCVNPCVDTLGEDTSNGCEFYANEMDIVSEPGNSAKGACYAVFIVNQWKTGEPAKIQVDRAGTILPVEQFARIPTGTGTGITYSPFDATTGLPQNEIAILFLSRDPAAADGTSSPGALAGCPPGVTPAIVGDASITGTGTGSAFHIKTNVPVVGYQIYPYGGGRARVTAATLLLPTNVWGTNYIAADAYAASGVQGSTPTMTILAQTDNTHVTINPVAAIEAGGGLSGTAANTPISYTLDQGEYLQFTQTAELTGSPIQSDNPVAVIGGQTLMDVLVNNTRADGAEQMLPPVQALGNQYVGVRYRSRVTNSFNTNPVGEEVVPWRIVGVVDGTQLTFDPPVAGAPTTVNSKQFVEFDAPGPFVVSSQDSNHPFYFAQYMTGGFGFGPIEGDVSNGLGGGEGDPEFVNVIAPANYLPRYTFFTDPTYPETNLVVTRVKDPTLGFPDVSLDCAGTLSGWTDIGTSGNFQFTRTDLSINDFQGVGGCNNGVHTIVANFAGNPASPTPAFGVTIWGWGSGRTYSGTDETNPASTRWVSYAYPAGANITQLNSVVVSAH
jgi:hypothetical protein